MQRKGQRKERHSPGVHNCDRARSWPANGGLSVLSVSVYLSCESMVGFSLEKKIGKRKMKSYQDT